ncbi:MAG: retroviral-like aspartic protease family protein, partial [Anaerolineae bacterium]|nr:retroviral-like aspartic protease family protein [Caldilineales bacterium]MDW8270415.1 retroviral-like aspartic protease family protein [Anaerolineae bacterium]
EKIDLCLFTMQFSNRPVIALFDTGAGISAVNTTHLNELHLNLKPAFELEVGDATGEKVTQSIVRCSDLSINGILLPPFDCLQSDFQSIENAIGHRIDLIFGANILLKSGLRWLFDKPAGKVFIAE